MTTVFFIHGTGVREKSYQKTKTQITEGLIKAGIPGAKVQGVSWGRLAGTDFNQKIIEKVAPDTEAKSVGAAEAEDINELIWDDLLDDPLYLLRLMSLRAPLTTDTGFSGQTIGEQLVGRINRLKSVSFEPAGEIEIKAITTSADWLMSDDALSVVLRASQSADSVDDPALLDAIARAIVAYALSLEEDLMGGGALALYDIQSREELTEQIEAEISELEKGFIGDAIKGQLVEWGKSFGTKLGRKKRRDIMGFAGPAMGDIIYSQRRGQKILSLLKTEIEAVPNDVVILGHSLGGVLAVDLLSGDQRPANVSKLITVGSQPSYFGAADALETQRLDKANGLIQLPDEFPVWLNVYDRSDFLSFFASKLFASKQGIEDFEIKSGVSFPEAHGAYFRQDEMFRKIAKFL